MKIEILLEKIKKKYVAGMNNTEKKMMVREIEKFKDTDHTDPKAYPKDWSADKKYRERKHGKIPKSEHTEKYKQMFGEEMLEESVDKALKNKSEKTGISLTILRQVYNRGLAAWRTGHRPGVHQHQWAMGRVNSFIVGGPARRADKDLWAKAKK